MDRSVAAWRALGGCAFAVVALVAYRHDAEQRLRIQELEHARATQAVQSPTREPPNLDEVAERAASIAVARVQSANAKLAAAAPATPPRVAATSPSATASADPDHERASAQASLVLGDIRARGRIDRADVLALREAFRGADPRAVEQTRNDIAAAVNRGELAVADPRSLYP